MSFQLLAEIIWLLKQNESSIDDLGEIIELLFRADDDSCAHVPFEVISNVFFFFLFLPTPLCVSSAAPRLLVTAHPFSLQCNEMGTKEN